jgi:antitoxin component of MazEF toxin-antitoxin module
MSQLNYEELTKDLTTKSEKIRTLGRKGVPTADIARFLGIRYQHARNVLVDAGMQHGGMAEEMPELEMKMLPTHLVPERNSVWVDVGGDGSVIIPADLLKRAGLKPDGRVYIGLQGEGLELLSGGAAIRSARALAAKYKKPGVSVVDELIAERREEARRESEKI